MNLEVLNDPEAVGEAAAALWLERLAERPGLVIAAPAGRTPRPMYRRLRTEAARRRASFRQMHVFAVDELCAPGSGYFWRQVRESFLDWADVPLDHQHPFDPGAPDLDTMCRKIERRIVALGGLDLVLLGLGPNGHLACNEPGSAFDSRTRPVALTRETVAHIRSDPGADLRVSDRAVTLGLGTLAEARQVVVLVSGAAKHAALRRALAGPVSSEFPASLLQRLPQALVLADREAAGEPQGIVQ